MDCIYTDLRSAFDMIDFRIFRAKLFAYGLSAELVDWFISFLVNRELSVNPFMHSGRYIDHRNFFLILSFQLQIKALLPDFFSIQLR